MISLRATTGLAAAAVLLAGGSPQLRAELEQERQLNGDRTLAVFAAADATARASTVKLWRGDKVFALGTVVSAKGFVLTKASELDEEDFEVEIASGERFDGRVLAADAASDLALLRIPVGKTAPVEWLGSGGMRRGVWVATMGNRGERLCVGVIGAKRREIKRRGGVLGIMLDQNDDAEAPGVGVAEVTSNGPARKIGVKKGDLIVVIEGKEVHSLPEVSEEIKGRDPGEIVRFKVLRGEEGIAFEAQLAYQSDVYDMWNRNQQMSGPTSRRKAGFEEVLQTDLPLDPQSVGGPLLTLEGKAVGINIARSDRVTTFALPFEVVQRVLGELEMSARESGALEE